MNGFSNYDCDGRKPMITRNIKKINQTLEKLQPESKKDVKRATTKN